MSKGYVYGKGLKEFLAIKPDEDSSISWSVDFQHYPSGGNIVEACVKIRDCSRKAELEFSIYEGDTYEDRLLKVDILIESLQLFRSALAATESIIALCKPFKGGETKC